MRTMGFCPICGKSTKATFCGEHQQISFSCKEVVVRVCECRKYFYKSRWVDFRNLKETAEKIAKDCVKEKVKVNALIDEKIEKKSFEVEIEKDKETFILPAKLQVEQCPACSKKSTTYFEAVIQIRPKSQELYDFVEKQAEKEKDVFISKVVEQKDGYDFYVSSNKFALSVGKKLSKSFKGGLKGTRRLFSFDRSRSKNLYRSTVCFRQEQPAKKI